MFKKILLIIAMWYAAAALAAVDVNKANAAELDSIKGIGPGLSSKILDERKHGPFKDWSDFIARVNGMGEKTAEKFSGEGLTVNGEKFRAPALAPAHGKAAENPAERKADKKAEAVRKPKGNKDDKDKASATAAAATQTPSAPAHAGAAPAASDTATKK